MDAPEGMPDGAVPFRIDVLCLEGWQTSDSRELQAGGGTHRPTPMPLQATDENAHGGIPGGAVSAGVIATLDRVDASALVDPLSGAAYGDGVFAWAATGWFAGDDTGIRFARLAAEQRVDGVSVDLGVTEEELEVTEEDEDGWPTAYVLRYVQWEIMGATQVPFPAFAGARIIVDAEDLPGADTGEAVAASAGPATDRRRTDPGTMTATPMRPTRAGALVAASAVPDDAPPAEWFTDPQLDGPTLLTVDADGRVFGHIGTWGQPHTGDPTGRTFLPRSRSDYAYFHTGQILTAAGSPLAVGRLSVGGGHADIRLGLRPALAHYDDVATCAAYVRAGEDAHGVWVAGALTPGLGDLPRRQLMAHPPSGDWRNVGTGLELIAVCSVNAPGFPVVPRARVASGELTALVAAGVQPLVVAAERRRPEQATAAAVRAAVDEALAPFRPLARRHAADQALTRIRNARGRRDPA